jgi:hypothetical protein
MVRSQRLLLLTNNRRSMPEHLAEHVKAGRHMPGIFVVEAVAHIVRLSEGLSLIAGASFAEEFQDQIQFFTFE